MTLIQRLKEINVLQEGSFALSHTEQSDYYVDIKKAYGYPDILNEIINKITLHPEITCLAASGYGGIPLATALSLKHNLYLTLVRSDPKEYGTKTLIDGYIPNKEDKVAVVDDVLTTGNSLKKVINTIKTTEAEILACYVVIKRNEVNLEIPVYSILEVCDLF